MRKEFIKKQLLYYKEMLLENPDLVFLWQHTTVKKVYVQRLTEYIVKCITEMENPENFRRVTKINVLSKISGISRPTLTKYFPLIMFNCFNKVNDQKGK